MKLIRDKIPEMPLVTTDIGRVRRIRAGSDEHVALLRDKLQEEVAEYLESVRIGMPDVKELADIYTVIEALARYDCHSPAPLQSVAWEKDRERGRFDHPLVLE